MYNDSYSDDGKDGGENTVDTSNEVDTGEESEKAEANANADAEEATGKIDINGDKEEDVEKAPGAKAENAENEKPEYDPQSRVKIDGTYYRTDDNGKIHMYMDDDKQYKLIPDNEYTSHGYDYQTDDKGRIVEAHGQLRLSDDERGSLNAKVEDMKHGDERGHIIAAMNDASDRSDNLVPMTKELNDGEYKSFENSLNRLVKDGHEVEAHYNMIYNEGNDSKRPDAIAVTYTVDGKSVGENGETYCRIFDNTPKEAYR